MTTLRFILLLILSFNVPIDAATNPSVISSGAQNSATAHGDSLAPSFSSDGRFVVFVSRAKNLATNGAPSAWLDVFLHDLDTGRTELVSVNTNGVGGGNGNSIHPSVSSNGMFVTFQSEASNVVTNDTNQFSDIFVRDMTLKTTALVSISTNNIADATGASRSPTISQDGSRIVFETLAWNLFPNDTNYSDPDIVLHDRVYGSNILVSIDAAGWGSGFSSLSSGPIGGGYGVYIDGYSQNAALSDDGRFVIFQSENTNMVANANTPDGGVFVRDTELAVTYWASAGVIDPFLGIGYVPAVISADGRVGLFTTARTSTDPRLFFFDIANNTNSVLATNVALNSFANASTNGHFVAVSTTNSLAVLDTWNGTSEIICGEGVASQIVDWRGAMISGNAQRVTFAARTNASGPWFAYVFTRATGTCQVVSVTADGQPAEIGAMSEPVISRDGRRVVFESHAANIVADDFNDARDIFVRDLDNNTTQLISARSAPTATPPRSGVVSAHSATELARVVAFTSHDRSLDPTHDNRWRSAFIHDRLSGTNRALFTAASRALGTNRLAFRPRLSRDGRYAAWLEHPVPPSGYIAGATNIFWLDLQTGTERVVTCRSLNHLDVEMPLIGPYRFQDPAPALSDDGKWLVFAAHVPGNPYSQVFRRDMMSETATNELLSHRVGNAAPATGDSFAPQQTPDGKWVLFLSQSRDVVTNDNFIFNAPMAVARNMVTGEKHWVSTTANGALFFGSLGVIRCVISCNSRYVFSQMREHSSSTSGEIYRHDLKTRSRTNVFVAGGAAAFSVSTDGDVVAYRGLASDPNVYVRDIHAGATTLISTNVVGCCGGGNRISFAPVISGDGRYVVFASAATNLVFDDTNNAVDVFVHDRTTRITMLVSRNPAGAPGAGSSSTPVLAPDGRTIIFSSSASDFAADDFNNARDIFVLRLGGEDSDLDGMDDDWESTYFNTLTRDGAGDFDGDGASDRHEFGAGTDPTNIGSIFRAITVDASSGTNRLIIWQSQANRGYVVQFKNGLDDPYWDELGSVTASGTSASLPDTAATPLRIYRVVLQP